MKSSQNPPTLREVPEGKQGMFLGQLPLVCVISEITPPTHSVAIIILIMGEKAKPQELKYLCLICN